jgi:hypothetical protein
MVICGATPDVLCPVSLLGGVVITATEGLASFLDAPPVDMGRSSSDPKGVDSDVKAVGFGVLTDSETLEGVLGGTLSGIVSKSEGAALSSVSSSTLGMTVGFALGF